MAGPKGRKTYFVVQVRLSQKAMGYAGGLRAGAVGGQRTGGVVMDFRWYWKLEHSNSFLKHRAPFPRLPARLRFRSTPPLSSRAMRSIVVYSTFGSKFFNISWRPTSSCCVIVTAVWSESRGLIAVCRQLRHSKQGACATRRGSFFMLWQSAAWSYSEYFEG